ncbi:hypothetical protein WAH92_22150, partial [Acinetobacter baumannii]
TSNFQPVPVVEVFDSESEIFSEQELISEVLIDEVPAEIEPVLTELEVHNDQLVFDNVVTELATPVEAITSVTSEENEAVVEEQDIT